MQPKPRKSFVELLLDHVDKKSQQNQVKKQVTKDVPPTSDLQNKERK